MTILLPINYVLESSDCKYNGENEPPIGRLKPNMVPDEQRFQLHYPEKIVSGRYDRWWPLQ